MNAIIGMTVIANSHLDDKEKVEDCLDKISVSGNYLLSIINDVLDMSKIESGKFTLNEENTNLCKMLDGFMEIVMLRQRKSTTRSRLTSTISSTKISSATVCACSRCS